MSPLIEKALRQMAELDFQQARRLLSEARALDPGRSEILGHLFTIDKQDGQSNQFHQTARAYLEQLCGSEASHGRACAVFREYMGTARPPKLPPELYLRMAGLLALSGELKEAGAIVARMMKKAPLLPGIPGALLKLSQAFQRKGEPAGCLDCLKLLASRYPHSPEAAAAKRKMAQP